MRAQDLGWHKVEEAFAGLHLVADGQTIRPDVEGLTARFVLPAAARAVRLVSTASVPAHVVPGARDDRRLGAGFHALEGVARWTDGAALLPASLWADCRGTLFLRVTLAEPALPRWVGPRAGAAGSDRFRRPA